MSKDKVVFLAHRNETPTDYTEHLTCSHCKNKTYVATYSTDSEFPLLKCACCGSHAGYFGWVDEENV